MLSPEEGKCAYYIRISGSVVSVDPDVGLGEIARQHAGVAGALPDRHADRDSRGGEDRIRRVPVEANRRPAPGQREPPRPAPNRAAGLA